MFQIMQQHIVFVSREQMLKEEVTYYTGHAGQFEEKEAMYEVKIPTDTEDLGTDQYDNKDSSDEFIGLVVKGNFLDYQETFIKSMENTRNSYSMFGKPCIPHSLLH